MTCSAGRPWARRTALPASRVGLVQSGRRERTTHMVSSKNLEFVTRYDVLDRVNDAHASGDARLSGVQSEPARPLWCLARE